MHYIPSYLRPLSQIHTGNESGLDRKADAVEKVETITPYVEFKQHESLPLWTYKEALEGKKVIENGTRIKREKPVDHPNRHWWIISRGFLEELEPALRTNADIFDLLIAINICIDDPVYFSQDPGQVVEGAYRVQDGALTSRGDLSIGNFPLTLMSSGEIPTEVSINREIIQTFEMVREFRSIRIHSDEDMDIRIALHMYDDGLGTSIWTSMANFYYVCENLLFSGRTRGQERDQRINKETDLSEPEARGWRKFVNRIKHPDKGDDVGSLIEEVEAPVPSLQRIRKVSNAVLVNKMAERYEEIKDS